MKLIESLRPECIEARISCTSKEAVLKAIAATARKSPALSQVDETTILKGLQDREALSSTGFGNHIAIPHCRLESVKEFVVGILSAPEGIAFDAMDDEPVKLFVFIVAPASGTNEHIRILSAISQVLNVPANVDEMVKAPTAEVLAESFLRNYRDEADPKKHDTKNLFRVQILDEELFRDVLKIFAGFSSATVMVTEAEPASNYLSKVPLFAGFWGDKGSDFCKVIMATVDKKDTNETIRRIEAQTGALDDRNDILLTVQELFYCAGSLSI